MMGPYCIDMPRIPICHVKWDAGRVRVFNEPKRLRRIKQPKKALGQTLLMQIVLKLRTGVEGFDGHSV